VVSELSKSIAAVDVIGCQLTLKMLNIRQGDVEQTPLARLGEAKLRLDVSKLIF